MTGAPRADWIAGERRNLGRYRLIRRLATGGMAEIYLARAAAIEGFEKFVVLKRILPQHADNENFIRMFLAEARLAATLHHPNIVQVYDIGEDEGTYFFSMEYVQGVDLRQLFTAARRAERPLPLQHIVHIITGVCAGLHYAHQKKEPSGASVGIVHRDISPSNVLVTFDGGVKVVDFGIAKAANVSTTAGTLKGKIPYMSPEQCRSEDLDRRSDVFSIGTLLWELTTGRRLFQADNELALLGVVAKGQIQRPSEVRPGYPEGLEPIVMRALAADRESRYDDAQQLQLALEDFAHEARLPLSAARLQHFVHEVCAERIAKVEAMLAADYEGAGASGPDAPIDDDAEAFEDETAIFGSGGLPSATPGPGSSSPEATAPGPLAAASATSVPVTTIASAPVIEAPATDPARRRRVGLMIGVVGCLGVVVAGGIVMSSLGGDPGPAPEPASPASAQTTPPASEAADGSEDARPAPAAMPEVERSPTPAEADVDPSPDDPSAAPAEGDASPSPAVDAAADAEGADRRAKAGKSPKRSTSRPSSGKSKPSSSKHKDSKPKWDPKAAPPPGL